jgi:elongation factor 3
MSLPTISVRPLSSRRIQLTHADRESLAALIAALKNFGGGVLIITHNREFSENICSEVWAMRDGYLEASGHNWVEGQGSGERIDKKAGDEEEVKYDALGNPIAEVKKEKKKSAAELRKAKKDRMTRRKRGEEVFTDEEL